MGKKTKIDWADATWNPVTGCRHDCPYCYARKIAERFGGNLREAGTALPAELSGESMGRPIEEKRINIHILDHPVMVQRESDGASIKSPYPYNFDPTLHAYRLDIPKQWTKPRTIFVCSMADLFGDWVPVDWIHRVYRACWAALQHRYIFLTKNPGRFHQLHQQGIDPPPGSFIGTSVTRNSDEGELARLAHLMDNWAMKARWFVSVEPILEELDEFVLERIALTDWVIIGAETGRRPGKTIPEKAWIEEIAQACKDNGTPVFMKESLRGIMGRDFRQEFPWKADDLDG